MTTPTAIQKPMPEPDEATAAFFDAAKQGKLLITQCAACKIKLAPGLRVCTECWSEDLDWIEASGTGTLFTFGVMHQKFPGFADDVPYNVAVVQLDEGPRMYSSVTNREPGDLEVGMKLKVSFEDAGNGAYIPRFLAV